MAENGEVSRDATSWEGVRVDENDGVSGARDNERSFVRGQGVLAVDVDDAKREVDTGDEEIVPDDTAQEKRRNGCFKGVDGS